MRFPTLSTQAESAETKIKNLFIQNKNNIRNMNQIWTWKYRNITVGSNSASHQFFIMLYIKIKLKLEKNQLMPKTRNEFVAEVRIIPVFNFFYTVFYSRILLQLWAILQRQLILRLICGFSTVSILRIHGLFGQKPLHCFNTLEFWFYTLLIQKRINWNQNQKFIYI